MGKKKERTGDASRHLGKRRGRGGNPTDRARKAPSSNDLGVELRLMFYSARFHGDFCLDWWDDMS